MNKQRVTLLSRAERAAAKATGGPMDCSIPEQAVIELAGLPESAVEAVGNALGRYRLFVKAQDAGLTDAQRREQAEQTRQMILALIDRMGHLDADITALIEETWWQSVANAESRKPFGYQWRTHAVPWLHRAAALMGDAAARIPNKGRTGPKRGTRDAFLRQVIDALQEASLTASEARARAAKIALACGIPAPTDERELRRLAGGGSSGRKSR